MELNQRIEIHERDADQAWLLHDPNHVHLAGDAPDLQYRTCRVTIGDRPIVVDYFRSVIKSLAARVAALERSGETCNDDRDLLEQVKKVYGAHCSYLVFFGVAIEEGSGLSELSFRVSWPDSSQVTILDYWPKQRVNNDAEIDAEFRAEISVHGNSRPAALGLELFAESVPLPFGASIGFGGRGEFVARLKLSISHPVVEAFGFASASGGWKVRQPELKIGSEQVFCQLIHTKKSTKRLKPEVELGGVFRGFFGFPALAKCKSLKLQTISLKQ